MLADVMLEFVKSDGVIHKFDIVVCKRRSMGSNCLRTFFKFPSNLSSFWGVYSEPFLFFFLWMLAAPQLTCCVIWRSWIFIDLLLKHSAFFLFLIALSSFYSEALTVQFLWLIVFDLASLLDFELDCFHLKY